MHLWKVPKVLLLLFLLLFLFMYFVLIFVSISIFCFCLVVFYFVCLFVSICCFCFFALFYFLFCCICFVLLFYYFLLFIHTKQTKIKNIQILQQLFSILCQCCQFRRIFSLIVWVNSVRMYDFACFSLNYRIGSRNG